MLNPNGVVIYVFLNQESTSGKAMVLQSALLSEHCFTRLMLLEPECLQLRQLRCMTSMSTVPSTVRIKIFLLGDLKNYLPKMNCWLGRDIRGFETCRVSVLILMPFLEAVLDREYLCKICDCFDVSLKWLQP